MPEMTTEKALEWVEHLRADDAAGHYPWGPTATEVVLCLACELEQVQQAARDVLTQAPGRFESAEDHRAYLEAERRLRRLVGLPAGSEG